MSLLEIADLRVSLGGSAILHGVTFDVAASGVTALLGRNGVGKTTTAKAILGLYASAGSIRFDGRELIGLPTYAVARLGIGYVPEDRGVFSALTVAENMRLAEPRDRATAAYDYVYELFPVLKHRAAQSAGTLSGGEQQMLAIGRILLRPNRLLVVDEPTKGLSPKVAAEVAHALKEVARTVPILLIEQNLGVVRTMAGRSVVLDTGRVAHRGETRDLLANPVLTNQLLGVSTANGVSS
ncbi:ABC transporter ATP-binding protein [Actinospica sp. MGRD01-02]|uniref:ABC transporter ATP-binding protein n=1 Tax=Actinospica acidithermotolerans TaxID=2828514 RepID=A0A941EC72_9ACTN|nr:ABC transporter ATP-binding protein [Actinospica acidithermotolerans]MBR7825184.1 ABC transporter ATP-binding protein [Actinospica acidithermotolerans]